MAKTLAHIPTDESESEIDASRDDLQHNRDSTALDDRIAVSIVIPAYNEERTIGELLARVSQVDLDEVASSREIIVVSDGSSDETLAVARGVDGVTVFESPENRGKGAAVRLGVRHATGDVILVQDADLEYDPNDYTALLEPFLHGADVVYGSRVKGFERETGKRRFRKHKGAYWSAYVGGRLVTVCTNLLCGTTLTDEPTGYKLFRTELLRSIGIESDGFEWEPEVTAKLARRNVRIREVPIAYHPRSIEAGKKIKWWHGLGAICTLLRYRFR